MLLLCLCGLFRGRGRGILIRVAWIRGGIVADVGETGWHNEVRYNVCVRYGVRGESIGKCGEVVSFGNIGWDICEKEELEVC